MPTNLHGILDHLFKDKPNELADFLNAAKRHYLSAGEFLFHQGEQASSFYVVLHGRLRALSNDENNQQKILGDIGAGEPVGEFAIFTQEPRMASVVAIRKSVVLEYDKPTYNKLIAETPELSNAIASHIIQRLRNNSFERQKRKPAENIAVICLDKEAPVQTICDSLKQELTKPNFEVNIHHKQVLDKAGEEKFFDYLDEKDDLSLLVCKPDELDWAKQCVLYADLILIVASSTDNPAIHPFEQSLGLYENNILNKSTYLLLLGEDALPKNTPKWLAKRKVDLHIHHRLNHSSDTARLGRIITQQAIGLVLGGGGAKGFAHVGAVLALTEAGVPIDFLGGTSAGALYGIAMAYLGFDKEKIKQTTKEAAESNLTRDITIPMVSLMTGKKFRKHLNDLFGETYMEDLRTTSYAVSTNYTKARMDVLKKGPVWRNVLASMSIPGVFPPVVIERNLHVDGGLMDNLPIEPMYNYPVGTIYAFSLSSIKEREIDYEETPSAAQLLLDKFSGKQHYKIPSLGAILVNSLTINSVSKQAQYKDKATHYIELKLKGYGMLDDSKWEQLIDKGYEQTKAYLESIDIK
jgi:NTE family protein